MRNTADDDALKRPIFGFKSKMLRLIWGVVWFSLFRFSPVFFHGWRALLLKLFGARIGISNFIYPTAKIWAPWKLETGDVVTLGPGVEVYNPGGVRLGHHTIISQDAYLCGATHDYNSKDFTYIARLIETKPYAWVCARATVLPGVLCGEGSVLGAGSVTSRNLEPWTVNAGNPAVKIKPRVKFL